MKEVQVMTGAVGAASVRARERMLGSRWEHVFTADWDRVLMIHLEVDPASLARSVPFALDLWEGRAFVTLVAFTMRGMRPTFGGALGAFLFRPIASHPFLNVRTYVRGNGEVGIHFMAEWLSNRLAVTLGPATFGLPYRHGRLDYAHAWEAGTLCGTVCDTRTGDAVEYCGIVQPEAVFERCAAGTRDEWLMERYTAYVRRGRRTGHFRVWHEPWRRAIVEARLMECGLLNRYWPWMREASVVGAHFCPGLMDVWMGRPRWD